MKNTSTNKKINVGISNDIFEATARFSEAITVSLKTTEKRIIFNNKVPK